MRAHWLLVCLILLAACSPPSPAAPLPTYQTLTVHYPAFMLPWTGHLRACAADHPEVDWVEIEISPIEAEQAGSLVTLWMGVSPLSAGGQREAYEIGVEKWAIIVNMENPFRQLSPTELRDIFSGVIRSWSDLPGATSEFDIDTQVWSYPASDPIASPYLDLLLGDGRLVTQAQIAPDPAAMMEAVAGHEAAIGYLPSSWLTTDQVPDSIRASIQPIETFSENLDTFTQPVLALTDHEPGGALRAILVCAQSMP